MANFTSQVFQNQFLPAGAQQVNAVVRITSDGKGAGTSQQKVVGLIVDRSGSMDENGKIRAAREALEAAIKALPESPNCFFFVIAGHDYGEVVVPLQESNAENKRTAIAKIKSIIANNGTDFGKWLSAAAAEFKKMPGAIRQAILLTDGKRTGSDEEFIRALNACESVFQIDSRGVGKDFIPEELRKIQDKLGGTIDMIKQPQDMAKDFEAIIAKVGGLASSDVSIQIWVPAGAKVKLVKQVSPSILDITDKAQAGTNAQTQSWLTGAWGEESRDYHIIVEVVAGAVGQKKLAGRVTVTHKEGGVEQKVTEAQLIGEWTDDEAKSAVINKEVANYTGQAELATAIQEGLAAQANGDEATATEKLTRAVKLAQETGNEGTMKLLSKVVTQETDGTVRLNKASKEELVELDTRSTRTQRIGG